MGFTDDLLVPLVDEGLGNSAYLLDLGDGRGLAVDASSDVRAVEAAARDRGLTLAYVVETHLHADFVSGARQLAHDHGALVLASAAGGREFAHQGLGDGDEVDLGGLTLRALATPGHTDEHLALLVLDGSREAGVFTGGSLIVDSAARTDLLGADRAVELARDQYRSLHRLAGLDDGTLVWPTHGPGSFCSAPAGGERTSTIGAQRLTNPLLAAPSEDDFVRRLLDGLGAYPTYFDRLAEVNRRGPATRSAAPALPPLSPDAVADLLGSGGYVVDARSAERFAAGHVRGSVSVPFRTAFATWLGWVVPADVPVAVVVDDPRDLDEVAWAAVKIGHDRLVGHLDGGLDAWTSSGRDVATTPFVAADRTGDRPYVDVRSAGEFAEGHVPSALNLDLGEVARLTEEAPDGVIVGCGHGERAMTAASLLERAGRTDIAVLDGGPEDYVAAHGLGLARGDS